MHFEYEITIDEYVSAHLLRDKLRGRRSSRIIRAAFFTSLSLLCLVAAWRGRNYSWMALVFLASSVAWLCAGFLPGIPAGYYRGAYRRSGTAGKRFKADVDEEGIKVEGDLGSWHVKWPGAYPKGENGSVFAFFSAGTAFIFGKKYLDNEQQLELRRLSKLE